ncbi:uncharacterized protein LOC128726551 [Anopheles nili]|uniref:uncharacterized protein LOC128726551 n=1 Tax=Anopheles nili TaxID=185578 RepID=UPI00237B65AB|nr:uncharacterized protein LOC128726551 [Anopheles nili]
MDVAPSMVQRAGDKLIVRRVVSGDQVHLSEHSTQVQAGEDGGESSDQPLLDGWGRFTAGTSAFDEPSLTDGEGSVRTSVDPESDGQSQLPQCKIKRNYSCGRCTYFTQNPRKYLTHLRDTHGEKIVINECKRCLYASRHYQKLVRHMKMVHGSVDGIRKSGSLGASRRRVQKVYSGVGGGSSGSMQLPKLSRSEATQLTTAYVQQIFASGLPKLLEEIEKSTAVGTSIAATNFARDSHMMQPDKEQPMPYSSDEIIPEASEGDRLEGKATEDGVCVVPKKRSRPIPNLIPLNVSTTPTNLSTAGANTGQKFVKPIPLSALKAENDENDRNKTADYPLSLTKHNQQPMTSGHQEELMTKCMYCELSFKTVEALANHIKLAHKEDLIAALLTSSFDESADVPGLARPTETERAANEIWRRLLACSTEAASSGPVTNPPEYDRTPARPRQSSLSNDETDDDNREEHQSRTFCGVETAPGYGEVTNRLPTNDPTGLVMKKVFKCPHCSFWASTASRFHVHIVGHLNKKPFECSLCAYRSNWRWDITKHIRLKTIRDPSHKNAGVLMNDETGRRNYTKYNKYIALMQITDK